MKHSLLAIPVLCAAFLAAGTIRDAVPAEAGEATFNSVQGVDYALQPGGRIAIKVVFQHELNEPPVVFKSFHPKTQIVLGFADTVSALPKNPVRVGQRELISLQVVQSGTRTRLIIGLLRPMIQKFDVSGNELLVTLRRPQLP